MDRRTRVRVKVCGLTTVEDAVACAELGVDAVGVVLWDGSPRSVSAGAAREIITALPPFLARVGVFVNASRDDILRSVSLLSLDLVQLAGDEGAAACEELARDLGPARLVKTLRPPAGGGPWRAPDLPVGAYHLDARVRGTYGGTGTPVPWDAARELVAATRHPVILAGGLTPANVGAAIAAVAPAAVDVSSGVERRPGRKDASLVGAFLAAAAAAGASR